VRKLITPVIAVALVCAVGAAPVSAAKPKPPRIPGIGAIPKKPKKVKFLATFEGKRTIKWNMPRWAPPSDCYHQRWMYGSGEETWQVKSAKPTKVLAMGSGNYPLIQIGSWELAERTPQAGIDAAGIRTRTSDIYAGSEPGSCGGESERNDPKNPDCGTRLPKHLVVPGFNGRKVYTEVIDAPWNLAPPFDKCTIWAPRKLHLGWDRFEGKLDKKVKDKNLFGKSKVLTYKFSDDWTDGGGWIANGGHIDTSAHMEWTLTLKRVK
jgi:hypothetical protein